MALSAAEKQRRYRLKRDADPQRRQEYLMKEREKYKTDLATGKRKRKEQMTQRELRSARKKWRKEKQRLKEKLKCQEAMVTSPETPVKCMGQQVPGPSRQSTQSKKKKNREKAKCYRDMEVLKAELKKEKKRADMYRKRWERAQSNTVNPSLQSTCDSPRTKTRKLLRYYPKKTVKKTLIFHNALVEALRKSHKTRKLNESMRELFYGNVLTKYKLKTHARREIGCHIRKRKTPKKGSLAKRLEESICSFYLRDDVSRMTTGLKNTITRKKMKKQKRLLNDTLKNLHRKYLAENTQKVSYETFTRLRPFWVVFPTELDRQTCLCKTCENLKFLSKKLFELKLLSTSSLEQLVKSAVCNPKRKQCMYGQCSKCKEKVLIGTTENVNDQVTWYQWRSVKETRVIQGKVKEVTLTKKMLESGRVADLVDKFHDHLWQYRHHSFNITNQLSYYKKLREGLKENQCLIHVDFSENYVGKLAKEVQDTHFGASKVQMTLHTGAYFVKQPGQAEVCETFGTVSDCLQHGPSAIWSHLAPVLMQIRNKYPQIDTIFFFSDGPTSQYRQKGNFYLLSTVVFKYGFKKAEWNYHEAGHGKGIPDAVGGTLKRLADTRVRLGDDINSARAFLNTLGTLTKIHLWLIEDVELNDSINFKALKSISGTLKLHQMITESNRIVRYRDVSCSCTEEKPCNGHSLQIFTFPDAGIGSLEVPKSQPDTVPTPTHETERSGSSSTIPTNGTDNYASASKTTAGQKNENKSTDNPLPNNAAQQTEGTCNTHQASEDKHRPSSNDSENGGNKTNTSQQTDSNMDFKTILSSLESCPTYDDIKNYCQHLLVPDLDSQSRPNNRGGLQVDYEALDLYPDDVPLGFNIIPFCVKADGNCLPSAGSVFAYGTEDMTTEIRVRIVNELVLNEPLYLDSNYLKRGVPPNKDDGFDLCKQYAQYSEHFVGDVSEESIQNLFRREVMDITKTGIYMGMWQVHALASVLKMQINLICPKRGSPVVRNHLHRLILPRHQEGQEIAHIMWSATREDMRLGHWQPNHFVPVLAIDGGPCFLENHSPNGGDAKVFTEPATPDIRYHSSKQGENMEYSEQTQGSKPSPGDKNNKNQDPTMKEQEKYATTAEQVMEDSEQSTESQGQHSTTAEQVMEDSEQSTESQGQHSTTAEQVMENLEQSTESQGHHSTTAEKVMEDSEQSTESQGHHSTTAEQVMEDSEQSTESQGHHSTTAEQVMEDSEQSTESQVHHSTTAEQVMEDSEQSTESQGHHSTTAEQVMEDSEQSAESQGHHSTTAEQVMEDSEQSTESQGHHSTTAEQVMGNSEQSTESQGQHSTTAEQVMEDSEQSTESQGHHSTTAEQVMEDSEQSTESQGHHSTTAEQVKEDSEQSTESQEHHSATAEQVMEDSEQSTESQGHHSTTAGDVLPATEEIKESEQDALTYGLITDMSVEIDDLLGKYVVINYESVPYPGYVLDIDNSNQIFIECMHRVGRKQNNCFSWPKKMKDKNWYDFEVVLAVIPEPKLVQGTHSHFCVENDLWQQIVGAIKNM